MKAQIVNREGSPEQWAADVLAGGKFVARLSVSTSEGVQTVRLRRMVDGETTGRIIGEWRSEQGRPWGMDAIDDMVNEALAAAAPEMVSAASAARQLGVDRATVGRWFDRGQFPGAYRTPGGQIRIPAADVETVRAAR